MKTLPLVKAADVILAICQRGVHRDSTAHSFFYIGTKTESEVKNSVALNVGEIQRQNLVYDKTAENNNLKDIMQAY